MMEIMKVLGRMVCTQRVAGLGHMNLRILENNKGKKLVIGLFVLEVLQPGKQREVNLIQAI